MIAGLCNKTVSKLKYVKKLNNMVILLEIIISWYSLPHLLLQFIAALPNLMKIQRNDQEGSTEE